MEERKSQFGLSGNSIIGAIVMVMSLVAIYIIAGFIFSLLYKYSLLLLIPVVLIDYKVITGYFAWLGRLLKNNTTVGLTAVVFSALGYPFVSLFLFGKALFKRRIKQVEKEVQQKQENEFVDFEDVVEEPPLQLPKVEKPTKAAEEKGGYDNMLE